MLDLQDAKRKVLRVVNSAYPEHIFMQDTGRDTDNMFLLADHCATIPGHANIDAMITIGLARVPCVNDGIRGFASICVALSPGSRSFPIAAINELNSSISGFKFYLDDEGFLYSSASSTVSTVEQFVQFVANSFDHLINDDIEEIWQKRK